jgi:hypothetical protein
MRFIFFITFYFVCTSSYSQESTLFGCWKLEDSKFDMNIRNGKFSRVDVEDYVRIKIKKRKGKVVELVIRRRHSFFDREKYILEVLELNGDKIVLRSHPDIFYAEFFPCTYNNYIFYKVKCSERDHI